MKLVKSLLLGAAATVVSVAAANAADLPSRTKGPAVEYVKVCDWITDAGFYVIPGTDTCIRVGGYVRAQYNFQNTRNSFSGNGFGLATSARSSLGLGTAVPSTGATGNWGRTAQNQGATARGTATLDARTRTSYGTLRAVMSLEGDSGWGTGTPGSSFSLDRAFIQWAGLTAGRVESFFEFYDNVASSSYIGLRASGNGSEVFAYTATFGGGFQATVSVENPTSRNTSVLQATGSLVGGGINSSLIASDTATLGTILPSRAPDVVGALYVEQSWGSAQLSGAWHQSANSFGAGTLASPFASKTVSGFAILGGVKINLPSLAAGDYLLVQGVYASGASNYLGLGGSANDPGASFSRNNSDYFINLATGQTQKQTGYNIVAEARHYWTPNVYQGVFGSYTKLNVGSNSKLISWTTGGIGNQTEYRVGTQIVWVPVKGFSIGVEGMYMNTKNSLAGLGNFTAPVGYKPSYDSYVGRVRINRSF